MAQQTLCWDFLLPPPPKQDINKMNLDILGSLAKFIDVIITWLLGFVKHELGSNAMKESYAEDVIMGPIQSMQDCGNHDISKMKNVLKFITHRKKKPIFEVWIFTVALFTPVHTIVLINDLKPEHNI